MIFFIRNILIKISRKPALSIREYQSICKKNYDLQNSLKAESRQNSSSILEYPQITCQDGVSQVKSE